MDKKSPLVSVIVVSFNEIENIGETLNSLMRQTYPKYEIIVYDNGSTDGTSEYITENFPNVNLIKGKLNIGFGGANNQAAKIANGKYLAFVNDDAYVTPGWLEPLVDLLEKDATIGCAGAELLCTEKRDEILCRGNSIHLSGVTYVRDRGKISTLVPPLDVGGISGAAFLINRGLFLEIGGFESLFFLYYEDTDLSLRLRLLEKRCIVIPGAQVYHPCDSKFSFSKIFYLERNRYLSLFSLMNIPMLLLMAPSMLVFEFFSWGYCLIRGVEAIRNKVKAWKSIYKHRSWIKERRRKFQNRKVRTSQLLQAFTPYIQLDYVYTNKLLGLVASVIGFLIAVPSFTLFVFPHKKR